MRDVMRHMLFRQKALPSVPVPRNDLTKLILASHKDTRKDPKLGNAIIALAQESFPKTIGMEMKELRVAPISKGKAKIAGELLACHYARLPGTINITANAVLPPAPPSSHPILLLCTLLCVDIDMQL